MAPPKKLNIVQICADIREWMRGNSQRSLKRGIHFDDIPDDDVDVLFKYLSVHFITELFGGNLHQQVKIFNARLKEKEAKKDADEINSDESNFEKYDPSGVGGHQYAERLKQKAFRALEGTINQSAGTVGHSQYVQACKALIDQAEKTKLDSAEIMMAYESQLLVLAEFLVETFLPKLGTKMKAEIRDAGRLVTKKIFNELGSETDHYKIWKKEINRVARGFELRRFELILAELMVTNKRVREAFDFSKDLIANYKLTSEIPIDDKAVAKLKEHVGKRS